MFSLVLIFFVDVLYNTGVIIAKLSDQITAHKLKIVIDILAIIGLVFLFYNIVDKTFDNKVNSLIFHLIIIGYFGGSILFKILSAIKLYSLKNHLFSLILYIDTILACLMAFFLINLINNPSSNALLVFGVYTICYGLISLLLVKFLYKMGKENNYSLVI